MALAGPSLFGSSKNTLHRVVFMHPIQFRSTGPDEFSRPAIVFRMYTIPAGTPVSLRNLVTGKRIARYETRKPLSFTDLHGTGWWHAPKKLVHML